MSCQTSCLFQAVTAQSLPSFLISKCFIIEFIGFCSHSSVSSLACSSNFDLLRLYANIIIGSVSFFPDSNDCCAPFFPPLIHQFLQSAYLQQNCFDEINKVDLVLLRMGYIIQTQRNLKFIFSNFFPPFDFHWFVLFIFCINERKIAARSNFT